MNIPPDYFFRSHVMDQFRALADFIRHSEAQLQESYHTVRSQVVTELGTGPQKGEDPEEGIARCNQEIGDVDIRYRHAFTRIMRYSFVTMCFTLFESNLSRIARRIVQQRQLDLNMEDLKAKHLTKRFKKFWTKVVALEWWPEQDSRWTMLQDVEEIRNCITHRYGVVRENEKRIHELVARKVGVRLIDLNDELVDPDDEGSITMDAEFCLHVVKELSALVGEIFDRAGCSGQDV